MNPSVFFDNFSLLADSPNGVQKLRKTILQLAVMGKLVPQDPKDEPASVLLEKIREEKERLVKEGKIKKSKTMFPPEITEGPYRIPNNWQWSNLGTICTKLVDGSHNPPKKQEYGIPMLSSQNVLNNHINFFVSRYVSESDYEKEKSRAQIEEDDIFLTIVGSIGRAAVVPKNMPLCAIQRSIALLRAFTFPYYLVAYLQSPIAHDYYNKKSKGTAQMGLYLNKLSLLYIPLPPLEEQKRIVAKVDQLMALCDELEALHHRRNESRVHLNNATINRLLDAGSVNEFNGLWQLIYNNFDLLYDNLANVAKLRKTILQLAVMGKLVPQDPKDEPASVLLEKIRDEKEELSNSGHSLSSNIPDGWIIVPFRKIIELISGQHIEKKDYNVNSVGVPYLTGPIDFGSRYPIISKWTEKPKVLATKNDILVTVKGAGLGKNNIVNVEEIAISRQLMAIRCKYLDFNYIHLFIQSKYDYFQSIGVGIAIPGINRNDILNLLCPLPPLEEQKRIVAKVDQLMALCDELEMRIRKAQEDGKKITNAVVSNLTAM